MKLVPSAVVTVIYSEAPISKIKRPYLSLASGCVYNQKANGGLLLNGTAETEVLTSDQIAIMQYCEYRMSAVESS
jgi:hypothetical protein